MEAQLGTQSSPSLFPPSAHPLARKPDFSGISGGPEAGYGDPSQETVPHTPHPSFCLAPPHADKVPPRLQQSSQ